MANQRSVNIYGLTIRYMIIHNKLKILFVHFKNKLHPEPNKTVRNSEKKVLQKEQKILKRWNKITLYKFIPVFFYNNILESMMMTTFKFLEL